MYRFEMGGYHLKKGGGAASQINNFNHQPDDSTPIAHRLHTDSRLMIH